MGGNDGSKLKALKVTNNGTLQVAIISDSSTSSSGATATKQDDIINSLDSISKVVYNNGKVVSSNPNGNLMMGYTGSQIRALNVTQNGSLQVHNRR